MIESYAAHLITTKIEKKALKKEITALSKLKDPILDAKFEEKHDEAFEQIDCLSCGNCCKTTSPIITHNDLKKMAKALNQKPGDLYEEHLREDEDGDMVFRWAPCPMLGPDNHCSIYDSRPKACKEYPHTNRKKIKGIMPLHEKNAQICPAVGWIFRNIKP